MASTFHHKSRRPRSRGDPYAVSSRWGTVGETFCNYKSRWLWVPAFAGTTGGEMRLRHSGRCFVLPRPALRGERVGVSDYLRCQVALAYCARASRAFALRRTSSLWARAIRTTIFSFPAASNLSRNSARVLSYLAAIAATRNRIERTLARPPRMDRLPWRLPLSSASGARPTSLAMALLE